MKYIIILLAMLCPALTADEFIIPPKKKQPKVTMQQCYDAAMENFMIDAHLTCYQGQNRSITLALVDDMESATQAQLNAFREEEKYIAKEREDYLEKERKHNEFLKKFKQELEAPQKKNK